MRTLAAIALLSLLSGFAFAFQTSSTAQKDFDALLAKVKKSDDSVDFAQLRRLYTQTDAYSPYGDSAKKEMYTVLNNNDFKKARSLADEALTENYLNIDAHLVKMIACDKLGEAACSAHHKYVAKGIIDSILKSGDGKSTKGAMFVISVAEEYAVIRVLGLRPVGQALNHSEGHSYDVLTVMDPNTKEESTLYFNIDVIFAGERRLLEKKNI
jgi:hypothetical protein